MRGPYRKRRIHQPANFKPGGIPRRMLRSLNITVDEYEALRLADYEDMEHLEASEKMAISRPTFTRLIEKARHKIAKAIIDGMELKNNYVVFIDILIELFFPLQFLRKGI